MNFSARVVLSLVAVGLPLAFAPAQEWATELPGSTPPAGCQAAAAPERGEVFTGAGFYLIQPFFENNPAYNLLQEGAKPEFRTVDRVSVSQHLGVAPLVWLGYLGEDGLGARARYWSFTQDTSQTVGLAPFTGTYTVKIDHGHRVIALTSGVLATVTSAAPLGLQAFGDTLGLQHGREGTVFTVTTKLAPQILDLEAIQDFRVGSWDFLLSGGVRLGRLDQEYNASDFQSASLRELRILLSTYRFQGAGPVVAAEARLPISAESLFFYGSTRGSALFGSANQDASFGGQELRNEDPNPQVASDHHARLLGIVELEFGLEYRQAVGPTHVIGQIGVVGQDWLGAGNASHSVNLTTVNSPPAQGGAVSESDMALFGLAFRLGVTY
jgi:hypothetical protein